MRRRRRRRRRRIMRRKEEKDSKSKIYTRTLTRHGGEKDRSPNKKP